MEKFSYETNGYNRNEVNQFISDVIRETEAIITRVKKQSTEIEELKKELEHYKSLENTLKVLLRKEKENNVGKIKVVLGWALPQCLRIPFKES